MNSLCVWVVTCPPGTTPAGFVVTPQMLLQQALAQLRPLTPKILTAPPRGSDGVVGLPEWYWLDQATAGPITKRLTVGPVWVQVTASAQKLTVAPGSGLPSVACPDTGTPYRNGSQRSSCSYLYSQSSAQQPGGAYSASATVMWGGTWLGSDGTSGPIPVIPVTASWQIRIAEAQALNGGGR